MTSGTADAPARGAAPHGDGTMIDGRAHQRPEVGADRWLALAAAPTFAIMAVMSAIQDIYTPGILCSAAAASPLTGMIPMYLLMSAFHSAPWLRLFVKRRRTTHRI